MNLDNIAKMSFTGIYVGLGVGVTPLAITTTIACSKIILVNIIADIAVRLLTFNTLTMKVYNVGFVDVPVLWQISFISAKIGAGIVALSMTALLVCTIYDHFKATQRTA